VDSLWTHWHGHPDVLIGLAALEVAYLLGVGPLRERYNLAEAADPRQVATFTTGVIVIFLALLSPLHVLSDSYLFSAHMLQHILVTLVAPPLLILGTPDWLLRRLMRPDVVFRVVRRATHPVVAFVTFNAVFSTWHMPALYNLSMTNHGLHIAEHVLFMGVAVLLWWPLVSIMPELPRLSYPLQMGYLFLLSIAQIIVFAPVTFARNPLYEWYVNAPEIWSISAVTDQQVGAIIMKIGGGVLFMTLMIVAFFRWFNDDKKEQDATHQTDVGYSSN
jgi:putative membrane protein